MSWFKRIKQGVTTKSKEKKEIPEGLWYKCPECKNVMTSDEHAANYWVCSKCEFHDRIGSAEYFSLLFDEGSEEVAAGLTSGDPLTFVDTKAYTDRIRNTISKTGLEDAIRVGYGRMEVIPVVIACMAFAFFGGSMGSVVGEKFARGADKAIKENCAFICISKSGGARMMEAGFSLMQMAKTSAKLTQLADHQLPYISILT
ncbi:MAG: acetyl-CoA carboxylase carboxyltransferase subunit beta, partial [Bacteroidota bacterium]